LYGSGLFGCADETRTVVVSERLTEDASSTVVGDVAIVEGRAAFVLSQLLARSMRRGLRVREIVAEARLAPVDQAAVLRAELALEEAGERWRIAQRKPRANSETGGNADDLASEGMSVKAAARVLARTESRVRQIARAGGLGAVLISGRWVLDRREVISYRCQPLGADVDLPPLVGLPSPSNEVAA
jgi:hypothetical protein